jgi:hypothetical protein
MAGHICVPELSGDKSVKQTPSTNSTPSLSATAQASLVLPTPPAPTSVTRGLAITRSLMTATSVSRSTSRVINLGRGREIPSGEDRAVEDSRLKLATPEDGKVPLRISSR